MNIPVPPTVNNSFISPMLMTSSESESALQKDYPNAMFWTRKSWREHRNDAGVTRISTQGTDQKLDFLEDEDGEVFDTAKIADVRRHARQIFNTLALKCLAPATWSKADVTAVAYYRHEMCRHVLDLRLCENSWKADAVATEVYPLWSRHRPDLPDVKKEQEDLSVGEKRKYNENSSAPDSKRAKTAVPGTQANAMAGSSKPQSQMNKSKNKKNAQNLATPTTTSVAPLAVTSVTSSCSSTPASPKLAPAIENLPSHPPSSVATVKLTSAVSAVTRAAVTTTAASISSEPIATPATHPATNMSSDSTTDNVSATDHEPSTCSLPPNDGIQPAICSSASVPAEISMGSSTTATPPMVDGTLSVIGNKSSPGEAKVGSFLCKK